METAPRIPWTWEVPLADAKITGLTWEGKNLVLSLDCSWTALNRARHIKRLIFENCSSVLPGNIAGRFWFRERVTRAGARQRLCLTTADVRDRKRDYEFEFSSVTAEK